MSEERELRELPESWRWKQVQDISEVISITHNKLKQRDYNGEGKIPVIDQGRSLVGGFTNREELIVDSELPVVIFGDHSRSVKFIDFRFVAGADGIKVLKPYSLIHPKLFYYFLQSLELPDKGYSRHYKFLKKSYIPIPPIDQQKHIVDILDVVTKIISETREELSRIPDLTRRLRMAIFSKAFRGELTGSKTDSMNKALKGWKWMQLDEACEVILGQSPPSSTYNKEGKGLPFYQGKSEFGLKNPTPRKWCTKPKRITQPGDILISVRAPVGPVNMSDSIACIGRGLAALRPLNMIDSEYIFHYMRSTEQDLASMGSGSTFKAIRGKQLRTFRVLIPPIDEQRDRKSVV